MKPIHARGIYNAGLSLVCCPYCLTAYADILNCLTAYADILREGLDKLQQVADEHNRFYKHEPPIVAQHIGSGVFADDFRSGEGWIKSVTLLRKSEFIGRASRK
jgi:hypothetical protein